MPKETDFDGAKICNMIKYTYSVCLLIFSTTVIMGLIFTKQTRISADVHPALAFVLIWGAIIWLSMVEGGQASYVGLPPVDRELYKESHPLSYKCTGTTNKGDNLDRYLLGRQFCVLCTVFIINMSGAPIPGAELWGFPEIVTKIFLGTGLAMIFFTAMIGQLTSQVNASHCMLDYINNWLAVLVLYACMAIEWSGLIHASYLVQFFVCWLAGEPVESKEPEKSPIMKLWFWARCAFSTFCLAGSCAVTFAALFKGQTTMWPGVPGAVSVIVFIILMSIVGLLEGMQIAFFAVSKIEEKDRGDHKCAKLTCDLLFKGKGHNLPGFMIGRQLCVVSCFFIIARVTSLAVPEGEENIFGVSDGMQAFFDTGLCGALITTILGSIAWQLVAGVFPIAFLSNPMVYIFLRICLFLEATGLCAGSWVLAFIQKKICGYQRDEVYIGTAEERAAKGDPDHIENLPRGAGHMYKLPGFYEDAPDSLKELIEADPVVRKYMESIHDTTERDLDLSERDPESGDDVAASMASQVKSSTVQSSAVQSEGINESFSA